MIDSVVFLKRAFDATYGRDEVCLLPLVFLYHFLMISKQLFVVIQWLCTFTTRV